MKLISLYFILLGATLCISSPNTMAAEIWSPSPEGGRDSYKTWVRFSGEIVEGDYDRLLSALKDNGKLAFTINSRGGNVKEAIKIGRFVRSSLTEILAIEYCWSSCALIFAGRAETVSIGVVSSAASAEYGFRVIALHRPYLDPKIARELDFESVQKTQELILKETKKYLLEMGVENWVYEKMISKSSKDAWFLDWDEVDKVFTGAPAFQEWILAKCDAFSESERQDMLLSQNVSDLIGTEVGGESYQFFLNLLVERNGPNWRKKYDNLSVGYKTYLNEKGGDFYECKKSAIDQRHKEVMASLQ